MSTIRERRGSALSPLPPQPPPHPGWLQWIRSAERFLAPEGAGGLSCESFPCV